MIRENKNVEEDLKNMFKIKRITSFENYYHPNMGILKSRIVKIKKFFLGIPIETLHEYRETYYGEIKDCKNCKIDK